MMDIIPQKEFYFLRHGQTDYNLHRIRIDHPPHIPLNDTGRSQALTIQPIIESLPIKTICCSTMLRAQETKEIVAEALFLPEVDIHELGECNALVWQEMPPLKEKALNSSQKNVRTFVRRVLKGFQIALACEGPPLIISHGGVHWALCSLLNLEGHPWTVDNCVPIHFYLENGTWKAKLLKMQLNQKSTINELTNKKNVSI